jgi:uncharacterized protein (TIGR00369 family)
MRIWQKPISIDEVTRMNAGTASDLVGIEFTEFGDDFLCARLAVQRKTMQPYGRLHGGVSVVLAETLGSCAAYYACAQDFYALGLEINANHIKGVSGGYIDGVARPFHRGRSTQVWGIELRNEMQELICISRLTVAIVKMSS